MAGHNSLSHKAQTWIAKAAPHAHTIHYSCCCYFLTTVGVSFMQESDEASRSSRQMLVAVRVISRYFAFVEL